jgi:hypothetical protein
MHSEQENTVYVRPAPVSAAGVRANADVGEIGGHATQQRQISA